MGTKNNSENFISSITSSSANPFSSQSKHQYINVAANNQTQLLTNVVNSAARSTGSSSNFSPFTGKHKLPMQLSRPPPTTSIGVSVITPATAPSVQSHHHKEIHYKQQHQHFGTQQHMKIPSGRSGGDGYARHQHPYSNSRKMVQPPTSGGVSMLPVNHSHMHNTKTVSSMAVAHKSAAPTHTQHLPKYLSSSRFLVNTEKGDMYFSDDGIFDEIADKRTQYSNNLPPNFQYVLQDHSYSQLPESPPPPPVPTSPVHHKTTLNGLNRVSSSVGLSSKVTYNNNRMVNPGGIGFSSSSLPNNVNSSRLNHEKQMSYSSNNAVNNYSSTHLHSNNVSSTSNSVHNNITNNAISPSFKKNYHHSHAGGAGAFSHIPRGLLKSGLISDKPEESDLSEDDRLPDPHGEETETAPEAEGDEESVTRCICDFQHDDGYMISCDKCLAWQHVDCMGIDWHQIPDEYQCEKCQPRYIDKRRAIEIQKKKIENKLCVGLNDDSDSSDGPVSSSRNNKNLTKKKYKGKRTTSTKRKNIRDSKEAKPKRNLGSAKKRNLNDSSTGSASPQSPSITTSGLSAEKKKQLLIERKKMLLEKKQITKKRSMRKQAQSTKRNMDKMKMDDDYEMRNAHSYMDKEDTVHHNIQQVREWVDRYEEAVTNHYSQELRARLNAAQVNNVSSDLKFTASLRSIEKCRTSLLSTGGKVVLATCSLSPNQPIIELRGKYMYTGAESFKQSKIMQFTPYVFYYKLPLPKQDLEICVDCRSYGNFARFIRRSCKPNAELRHCIRKTSLHLYIIATQPLKKNTEILIGHYSPETANTCVCGSPHTCTASETPYPVVSSSGRLNDKSKESQTSRVASPASVEPNSRNKRTPAVSDRGKKKGKEGKKKLTKENRRGRRRSQSSRSNSDQEFSSREESPLPPAKLTVSLWGKPGVLPASGEVNNKSGSDSENQSNTEPKPSADESAEPDDTATANTCASPTPEDVAASSENISPTATTVTNTPVTTGNSTVKSDRSPVRSSTNDDSQESTNNSPDNGSTPKQNTRSTRQSDYARKEKQQLDMPLFFENPNHKMTREEKKIQAIMKVFEAMEKSEARKQENQQKHRRESTSENDPPNKKTFTNRKSIKGGRRSLDEMKDRDDKSNGRISCKDDDEDEDGEGSKENSMKDVAVKTESKDDDASREKKSGIIENGGQVKVESRDDTEVTDNDASDNADEEDVIQSRSAALFKKRQSTAKLNNKHRDESEESDTDTSKPKRNEVRAKTRTPTKTPPRMSRPMPKARATPKPKVTRGKKRKSESEADASTDTDVGDISERTRSAILRQKRSSNLLKDEKFSNDSKSAPGFSPNKFRKLEDTLISPCGTPPKIRERLDSSSSSGGTPPTPVSDTCLLVASAIGHLTDFKFPNTKKELMNAWFKEERKPSPDEENTNKLPNQEGNNEYAKKRWLRQAISEEGDSTIPRPDEAVSPNGEYGGPPKKRRFARESMSEKICDSPTPSPFGSAGQMSFDDETDLSSPDASLFRATEGDSVATCHPISLQKEISAKTDDLLMKMKEIHAGADKTLDIQVDEDIAKVASESVADTIASILAPVQAQLASPPRPPSVSPPRTPSPPPEETEKNSPETRSPPVSKKKLSLTEYQRRKGAVPSTPLPPVPEVANDVAQDVPTVADATPTSVDSTDAVARRPSSRSSVTSSSGSDDDEDDSHAASAQVIARSLMIESRHLSYGPQASALFNSIRSGAPPQLFNAKPTPTATNPPLARENLADRLKREFNVNVEEDENEKNKNAPVSLSPNRIPVQITTGTTVPLSEKDLNFRIKKAQPPPPPPPLPIIPPPLLPPLPDPPQLFAPTFYPYPVPRVAPFFTAPPPPPPSGAPPPVPPPSIPNMPPPPPTK